MCQVTTQYDTLSKYFSKGSEEVYALCEFCKYVKGHLH